MSRLTKAKNTLYFKSFNDDYHIGGRYHSLDNSEFRCVVILQSYADGSGIVANSLDKGYRKNELADMMGMSAKTTERALMSLDKLGIISIEDDDIIKLVYFVDDNVYRDVNNNKVTRGRANIAKGIEDNKATLKKIEENTRQPLLIVTDKDAEILGKAIRGEQNAD